MGFAIIVKNVSFEDVNLGKVTLQGNIPIEEINIIGNDSYTGTNAQLYLSFIPENTTQRSVLWSITEGTEYASINQDGNISIKEGANNNTIVVNVKSQDEPSVEFSKTINVTYFDESTILYEITNREVSGTNKIDTQINLFDDNHKNWTLFISVTYISGNAGIFLSNIGPNNQYNRGFSFQRAGGVISLWINGVSKISSKSKIGLRRIENKLYFTGDGINWTELNVVDGIYANLFVGNNDIDSYPDFSFNCEILKIWSKDDVDIQNYFN